MHQSFSAFKCLLSTQATLSLLIALICIQKSSAFQCYVCDSKSDIECTENVPADSGLVPQECKNMTGAKYCIKTTNIYAGEFGTKRFCAANDHGNYCKYIRQPTGDREYRSCVLTCSSENCNLSASLLDEQNTFYNLADEYIKSYLAEEQFNHQKKHES